MPSSGASGVTDAAVESASTSSTTPLASDVMPLSARRAAPNTIGAGRRSRLSVGASGSWVSRGIARRSSTGRSPSVTIESPPPLRAWYPAEKPSMVVAFAALLAAITVATTWSRSTSVSAAILCVTWRVKSENPTLRS